MLKGPDTRGLHSGSDLYDKSSSWQLLTYFELVLASFHVCEVLLRLKTLAKSVQSCLNTVTG